MLYKFIQQKGELRELGPLINSLTKQKTAAVTQLAKQGLKDLEELTALLKILGVKIQVQLLNQNALLIQQLLSQEWFCFYMKAGKKKTDFSRFE